jgi:eukaryotic-like serine/threonine-protein kinase
VTGGRAERTRITPERWQRLQAVFERALPLEPAARAQLLLEECGTDSSLREQVLALLVASSDDDGELERRIDRATSLTGPTADLEPGTSVGRYRIVRSIGRGGMGTVYLAERADQEYQQVVALKVMARGLFHGEVVGGRFRAERQILARLNHPNIARLLDGGQMQDGTPYLVMEHVEGVRIDDYCNERDLPLRQRLPLVQQVCAAVQYAHQNLVVHRDLKPSNILVTADGVPKLLDFGIAKLLTPQGETTEPLTRLRDRVLTPEHASPEQFRGEPIGTAADVYSLGTLFYRLLSGLHPFDIQGRPIREIEMLVCESSPLPPSERLLAATDSNFAKTRALARELKGDLDNIVLKAMHRDPERRYPSAAALAQDIQNYLSGLPVQAQPDSWTYRTRKFLRRNAVPVASGVAVAALIATLITFYTMRLTAERDIAERERMAANTVSDFMVDVFRRANPNETGGEIPTLRSALDAAAHRIDTTLTSDPALRFTLMRKMSDAYNGLGQWAQARALLEKIVAEQRATFGSRSIQVARTLEMLGGTIDNIGRYDEAAKAYEEAWAIRQELGQDSDADAAIMLSGMAKNLRSRLRFDEALEVHRRAEALGRKLNPPDARALGIILEEASFTAAEKGDYVLAERYARESVPLLRGVVNEGHDLYANALAALGNAYRRQFKLVEAEKIYRQLLERQLHQLGKDHLVVGRAHNNYSHVLRAKGDYEAAAREMREALRIFREIGPGAAADVATTSHNLGALHREAGDLPDALRELDEAIALKRAAGSRNPLLISSLWEKAGVLREMGQLAASNAVLAEAQSIAKEKLDPSDRRHAQLQLEHGRNLLAGGRAGEAESEIQAAVAAIRTQQDPIRLADALASLSETLAAEGKGDAARAAAAEALDIRQKVLPPTHPAIATAQAQMAALQPVP